MLAPVILSFMVAGCIIADIYLLCEDFLSVDDMEDY